MTRCYSIWQHPVLPNKKTVGETGENIALRYLQQKGYKLVGRNFRSPFGEIDLIMRSQKKLVFIEVKTRTSERYGLPEEAIGRHKLNKIIRTAQHYINTCCSTCPSWRIDIVSIRLDRRKKPLVQIKHLHNITL